MKIEITQNQDKSITLSGNITEYEISNIYCNASKSDMHKLHMMYDLAERSKRMSDYLMWISVLVSVNEDLNYKKMEDKKRVS